MNFPNLTPIVKNLLLINFVLFFADWTFSSSLHLDLGNYFGLHYVSASNFGIWQFITYMFMHSTLSHIVFNMLSLFIFGPLIENRLGMRRFVVYYLICGVGAGLLQQLTLFFEIKNFVSSVDTLLADPNTQTITSFISGVGQPFSQESYIAWQGFVSEYNTLTQTSFADAQALARHFFIDYQQQYIDCHCMVGASGAIFGILLAVGMLFPNLPLYIWFIPIPIKAKWFVCFYALFELIFGVADFHYDNVAHWAHLGGMIFGFLLLYCWRKNSVL